MTAHMDPDAVLNYKEHLTVRLEGLRVQESLLATDAQKTTDVTDTESGLIPQADWFGPDALWTEDVSIAMETVYLYRANEAATGSHLIEDLQETLQLFVDRWKEDEDAITSDMDELTSELEDWEG
jgi:hypothetical protein